MKKYIAIFTILAFVFAASFAFAGNSMTLDDTDDSNFIQNRTSLRTFTVSHYAGTVINSTLVIGANTGGNTLFAGDDLDAGSVNSGDANVIGTEQYDANGLDVIYNCNCSDDGADSNDIVADDTDDSNVIQTDNLQDHETISSGTFTSANLTTIVGANTGANAAGGGGDVGEDSPVTVDSGAGNVTFDRISVFNLVRITRTAL